MKNMLRYVKGVVIRPNKTISERFILAWIKQYLDFYKKTFQD